MKKNKLNNFINKHASLLNQFQNSHCIRNKYYTLKSIINVMNTKPLIQLTKDNNSLGFEKQKKQTYINVVKQFGRMYEGIKHYEQDKQQAAEQKQLATNSRRSNRSIQSAHFSRFSTSSKYQDKSAANVKKIRPVSNCGTLNFQYRNKISNSIKKTNKLFENQQNKYVSIKPNWNKKRYIGLKNEVKDLRYKAQSKYGIKFYTMEKRNSSKPKLSGFNQHLCSLNQKFLDQQAPLKQPKIRQRKQNRISQAYQQSVPPQMLTYVSNKNNNVSRSNSTSFQNTVKLVKKNKKKYYFRI